MGFGIALTILSNQIIEYKERYDVTCGTDASCDVTFTITETMDSPVFIYYELDNFYQNHRRYLKSRDNDQLAGTIKTVDELDDCDPVVRNKDVAIGLKSFYTNETLDSEAPANPCGLVAKSFFNGT